MDTIAEVSPNRPYRRHLPGADFSLEANTDAVPEEGHFYVLQKGQVLLKSDEFPEAMGFYQGLCREYWENHLRSDKPLERMASAWGLIGLEPNHPSAIEVIRQEGTPQDMHRLEQIRRKKRFQRKRGAQRNFAQTG